MNDNLGQGATDQPPSSPVGQFIDGVAKRTTDPVHHRLLSACLRPDPSAAVEAEFKAIVAEILHAS